MAIFQKKRKHMKNLKSNYERNKNHDPRKKKTREKTKNIKHERKSVKNAEKQSIEKTKNNKTDEKKKRKGNIGRSEQKSKVEAHELENLLRPIIIKFVK